MKDLDLIVTKGDGVPLPDQESALKEFKKQASIDNNEAYLRDLKSLNRKREFENETAERKRVIEYLRNEACRDVLDKFPQSITQHMRYVADYLESTNN